MEICLLVNEQISPILCHTVVENFYCHLKGAGGSTGCYADSNQSFESSQTFRVLTNSYQRRHADTRCIEKADRAFSESLEEVVVLVQRQII